MHVASLHGKHADEFSRSCPPPQGAALGIKKEPQKTSDLERVANPGKTIENLYRGAYLRVGKPHKAHT
jgi:hypothetical protein